MYQENLGHRAHCSGANRYFLAYTHVGPSVGMHAFWKIRRCIGYRQRSRSLDMLFNPGWGAN